MTVAEAPRWRNTKSPAESAVPHATEDQLHMESRIGADVRASLERLGYRLNVLGRWDPSSSEVMIQGDSGLDALLDAADTRRDG